MQSAARRALRIGVAVLLFTNALDLSTSLVPYWIDKFYTPPPRSTLELILQLGLLALGAAWFARITPRIARTLAALPIPRAPLIVCGGFLLIECAHIALRFERFPFSPVAMFSDAHTEVLASWEQPSMLVQHPEGPRFLSFQREGDPLFSRYFDDLDYKGSAALRMYRDTDGVAKIVRQAVAARGLPPPVPVWVTYRTSDGKVLSVAPRVIEARERVAP
jgi:hypothetical protein